MAALRSQFQPSRPEAEKFRKRFNWLQNFTDEELRKISMCTVDEGEKQSNDEYFDLSRPELGPIRGRGGSLVPEGSCYVSRGQVDKELWNKLVDGFVR